MRSMTGFGSSVAENGDWRFEIRVHSINQKRLDIKTSIPSFLKQEEQAIREIIANHIQRGNVTVDVNVSSLSMQTTKWNINEPLMNQVMAYASTKMSEDESVTFSGIVQALFLPNAITEELPHFNENDRQLFFATLDDALLCFVNATEEEGRHLLDALLKRLNELEKLLIVLKECAPRVQKNMEEKLRKKLIDVCPLGELDEKRLLEEMVYYINKFSIDEELIRMESHLKKIRDLFMSDEPIGRSCDFYFQELNREMTTSGSKVNDVKGSQAVVEMKTILEQMREQIQNVV